MGQRSGVVTAAAGVSTVAWVRSLAQKLLHVMGVAENCMILDKSRYSHPLGILFILFFFRATPAVCRGSKARGRIGAAAAGPHHSSQQCPILTTEQGQGLNPNPHGH